MLRVWLGLAVVLCASLQAAEPPKKEDLKRGLVFTSKDAKGYTVSRLEPTVGITLNTGEAAHPNSDGGETFTWTGYIQIVTAGAYTFDATVQGEVDVSIDGQSVFRTTSKGGAAQLVGQAKDLTPGIYPFVSTLKRLDDAVRLQLRWTGPRFRNEPIPYLFFKHTTQQRPTSFVADLQHEHGRLVFEERGCIQCHAAEPGSKLAKSFVLHTGPNLSKIAERAYPGWLDAWLADPKKLRPHTAMPQMFTDDELGQAERYAVVSYLASLGRPISEFKPRLPYSNDARESQARGRKLFLTTGCATCHGDQLTAPPTKKVNDEDEAPPAFNPAESFNGAGTSTGPQSYYTLNHVGSKTRLEPLARWLQNPLATNPHGRMPNMRLNEAEATDLARYLCASTDDAISAKLREAPKAIPERIAALMADADGLSGWKAAGFKLFASKGCVNCHAVEKDGKPVASTVQAKPLVKLGTASGQGCTAEKPNPVQVPVYDFKPDERLAVVAYLKDGLTATTTPSPVHAARMAFKRFNCLNCHQREHEGGIELGLADKMKQLESADNADDVQPPQLTGVGGKMRTSWLREVLLGGNRARPWMNLRMPQFGEANLGKLHEHLPQLEGATTDDAIGKATFTKEKIETGKALAGKQGHGCISCHDISGQRGGGTRGPDLATTNTRVRYDWYTRWMHQPQRMAPGTKMPSAFIDGKALLTDYYNGDGDKQIDALWAYFSLGPGLPLPAGLDPPKGLIITVKDRPEILRTFMPDDAGTKCIAVGYPGGFNTVFDSAQCRLAYSWSGNFLDVSSVWNDRGGNPARIIGSKFWTAPLGHPWALTDSSAKPDFSKQARSPAHAAPLAEGKAYRGPMAVRFKAYSTGDTGNPTFDYQLTAEDGKSVLGVSETPSGSNATVANGMIRTFKLDVPTGKLAWLNVGMSNKVPRLLDASGAEVKFSESVLVNNLKVVAFGDGVQVFASTLCTWHFTKTGEQWSIHLQVTDGTATKTGFALSTWALPKDEPALLKELK